MLEALLPMLHTKLFWITAIAAVIYAYFKFIIYTYWKRKGIPHDNPIILVGNALPLVLRKSSIGNLVTEKYEKNKKHPLYGIYMFHKPFLIINDPELAHLIMVKEFSKFRDRGLYHNEEVDPLSSHLFLLPGEKWKKLRAKLTPTFTSGKLKQMFPLLMEIGEELVKTCDHVIEKKNVVDIKDLSGRYATDSISSIAFGFNCKSLENPDNDFKRHGSMVFNLNPIIYTLGIFAPIVLDILRIPMMGKEVIQFFTNTFKDMVDYRRQNNIVRKDFLNLLMQLMDIGVLQEDAKFQKSNGSLNVPITDKISFTHAQAQAFVFFVAGFESTSSTTTYCLHELALNPEIQEKLQVEIDEFSKKPGGMTYERILHELEYLDMVFSETLRKHATFPFLNRVCIEDYDIPNSNFRIEKGTAVIIPVSGYHLDPNLFPDPNTFDPLRFTKENIAARSPYVYLPFGEGPRGCIGTRFGTFQTKIALIVLLSNYKFSICDETPIPMNYSKRSFIQTPESDVYLKMEARNT